MRLMLLTLLVSVFTFMTVMMILIMTLIMILTMILMMILLKKIGDLYQSIRLEKSVSKVLGRPGVISEC